MGTAAHWHRNLAWRLAIYTGAVLAALVWTIVAGKDLNWDALNYHLYSGFSAVHQRFGLDYFAAGPPSYLNPYAHVPLYLMVSANWPSIAIGSTFACLHAVNLWLSYELALTLNTRADGSVSYGIAALAVIFALLNPVFLQEMGSTFSDISTGIPTLGGWVLLAKTFSGPRSKTLVLAGALLGLGAALKLSNAIYAVAALPILFFLPGALFWRMRALLTVGLGIAFGFALATGPWSWQLWKNLGNPFFPLFNDIFRSPYFSTATGKGLRFVPESFLNGLLRPFKMVLPLSGVHTEPVAPDFRYAALMLLLPAWALLFWYRHRKPAIEGTPPAAGPFSENSNRAFLATMAGFAAAWILWLDTSGNSRYFVPMGCVAGVLVASLLPRLSVGNKRLLAYPILVILAIQCSQLYLAGRARWSGMSWDGPWYQVSIPDRFKTEPNLYFSTDLPSGSFFLPFLAPGSGMISSAGQQAVANSEAPAKLINQLIAKNSGHLRLLAKVGGIRTDGVPLPPAPELLDTEILRFGLRTDPSDCTFFSVQSLLTTLRIPVPSGVPEINDTSDNLTYWQSCHLVPADESAIRSYREEQKVADLILDRVEDTCPNLFQPRSSATQKSGPTWGRTYGSTDMSLWVNTLSGLVKFLNVFKGGDPIVVGRAEDWARAPQPMNCQKKYAPPFSEPSEMHTTKVITNFSNLVEKP